MESTDHSAGFPDGHLRLEEYKTYVTGNPRGIVYVVRDEATGKEFKFDGFASGQLVFTVPGLGNSLGQDRVLVEDDAMLYLGLAGEQLAVAQGTPILWACQYDRDRQALTELLEQYEPALKSRYPGQTISVRTVAVSQ